jgi:maleamate amidohydrolase
MPVIHTRVVYQTGGLDGGLFYRKIPALTAFDEGSPLGRFPAAAFPAPGELVITKQYASAFSGTSLLSALNAQRIDSLLVCGFSTSGCVRATATDAIQLGIAPFVVREACADRNEAIQQANLFDLQAKYAEVIGIETVAGLIAGRAGQ